MSNGIEHVGTFHCPYCESPAKVYGGQVKGSYQTWGVCKGCEVSFYELDEVEAIRTFSRMASTSTSTIVAVLKELAEAGRTPVDVGGFPAADPHLSALAERIARDLEASMVPPG